MNADRLWDAAITLGFHPYPVSVERVPGRVLWAMGAEQLPFRFAHWIFGRDQAQMDRDERPRFFVLYHDPVRLLLDQDATPLEEAWWLARTIGHSDFFRSNRLMDHSFVDPLRIRRAHAAQIREWETELGQERVSTWIRHAWSIRDYPELLEIIARAGAQLDNWERSLLELLAAEIRQQRPFAHTRLVNEGWSAYCRRIVSREISGSNGLEVARREALAAARRTASSLGAHIFSEIHRKQGFEHARKVLAVSDDPAFAQQHLSDDLLHTWYSAKAGTEQAARAHIVHQLATLGLPRLETEVEKNGELAIVHLVEDRELEPAELKMTLTSLHTLYRRPIRFTTVIDGQRVTLRFEGGRLVQTRYH